MAGSDGSTVGGGGSGGAVDSVNSKTGAVTIASADSSITVDNTGANIDLSSNGVNSLNSQTGTPSIVSGDASVTITTPSGNIDLSVAASGGSVSYACVTDQKSANAQGGTFSSGAPRTRDVNTQAADPDNIVISTAGNQILLGAGKYVIRASAPSNRVAGNQLSIVNVTDAVTALGSTEASNTSVAANFRSFACGYFDIASSKAFEIRHECVTTRITDGFGLAANLNNEIYTIVDIWKIG